MNTIVLGALTALTMFQQTDTLIQLDGRELLRVDATGGSIVVDVWDRPEVRIRGEHSSRTYVDVRYRRNAIQVESEARRGPANIVDYRITVPRTLSLSLEGHYADITVEGADGRVEAETVQGDITILGGRGTVKASSATGTVTIEGADGQIEIESAAADVIVRDSSGDIVAESAGGNVRLENVRASSVDVGSVGGRVYFDGGLQPDGTYFFGTHGGSVTIVIPETARATFNVATVHGSISSNLEGTPSRFERGNRHRFEVNGGGALVEAETFGGPIRILRKGTEGDVRQPHDVREDGAGLEFGYHFDHDMDHDIDLDMDHDFDFDMDHDFDFHFDFDFGTVRPSVDAAVDVAMASVQPEIDVGVGMALERTAELRRAAEAATIRR